MRGRKRACYIDHVVAVLTDEFDWDEVTTNVCRKSLASHEDGFPAWFEFICDNPHSALWRLKSASTGPWDLRVAFYGRDHYATHHAEELTATLAAYPR